MTSEEYVVSKVQELEEQVKKLNSQVKSRNTQIKNLKETIDGIVSLLKINSFVNDNGETIETIDLKFTKKPSNEYTLLNKLLTKKGDKKSCK